VKNWLIQQAMPMPVITVQSLKCQQMKNYIMFHMCSSLSLMITWYYLSLLRERWMWWLTLLTQWFRRSLVKAIQESSNYWPKSSSNGHRLTTQINHLPKLPGSEILVTWIDKTSLKSDALLNKYSNQLRTSKYPKRGMSSSSFVTIQPCLIL